MNLFENFLEKFSILAIYAACGCGKEYEINALMYLARLLWKANFHKRDIQKNCRAKQAYLTSFLLETLSSRQVA